LKKIIKVIPILLLLGLLSLPLSIKSVLGWDNGGYSDDPSNPDYGTHDWIAQHSLDWLPTDEKQYIVDNLATYLYGTELPDNGEAVDGIGDTANHHVYFYANGSLQEDNSAVRASDEFQKALNFLKSNDYANAAKGAGIMSHYIVDVAVFGHVMGANTAWGAEVHHTDYEDYVNARTTTYSSSFDSYLHFDGTLMVISAYDATVNLAYDTTFDVDGDLTCVWMDTNYNWSNPTFANRCGESLNLAVNYLADVLHTLYDQAQTSQLITAHIVINEIEQDPTGTDAGYEWVELYNPTANSVNISDWTVSTTAGDTVTLTISSGTIIQANGYYLVAYGSQWLDNEGESIILRDSSGNEVDRTPSLSDTYNDGRSWQRYPNGQDTDSGADWMFLPSTKEESNGGEVTPSPTPTPSPSASPSPTPTPTPSPSPSPSPSSSPSPSPTPSLSPSPSPSPAIPEISPLSLLIVLIVGASVVILFKKKHSVASQKASFW
jgi:hypothetical protein